MGTTYRQIERELYIFCVCMCMLFSAVKDDIFLCGGINTDAAETCVKELFIFSTGISYMYVYSSIIQYM